jgi:hypothetical protein
MSTLNYLVSTTQAIIPRAVNYAKNNLMVHDTPSIRDYGVIMHFEINFDL